MPRPLALLAAVRGANGSVFVASSFIPGRRGGGGFVSRALRDVPLAAGSVRRCRRVHAAFKSRDTFARDAPGPRDVAPGVSRAGRPRET